MHRKIWVTHGFLEEWWSWGARLGRQSVCISVYVYICMQERERVYSSGCVCVVGCARTRLRCLSIVAKAFNPGWYISITWYHLLEQRNGCTLKRDMNASSLALIRWWKKLVLTKNSTNQPFENCILFQPTLVLQATRSYSWPCWVQ